MFPSCSSRLASRRSTSISSRKRAKRDHCLARALVEGLESRLMLSTYEVTSLLDVASSAVGYTGTLRWAIQQANTDGAAHKGPDTIDFAPALTGTIVLTQGVLTLSAGNTSIKGPGASTLSVSGGGVSSVFQVNSKVTASISGLTITDGLASISGGGINNLGTLTVTNDVLSDDDADDNGGGIDNLGTLTVTNDVLSDDEALANGGGIYSNGKLTVTGCTFSDDDAGAGGGISNYGKATITNCTSTFEGNEGIGLYVGVGGGIDNYGTLTVNHCTFSEDASFALVIFAGGGGISNEAGATLNVSNSTFSDDFSDDVGGGIYNDGSLCVTCCTFTDDSADNGGGIYNDTAGRGTVTSSTFTGNTAGVSDDGDGGGIDNYGSLVVSCCAFSLDTASDGGGGIDNELGGTLTVNNSSFSSDSANNGGGIANDYGGTLTVNNSTLTDDRADTDGGGIYNDGKLCVSCSTFSFDSAGDLVAVLASDAGSNTAVVPIINGNGGGIANDVQGTATITSSTFSDDTAGGSVNPAATADVTTGISIISDDGGAIYNAAGGTLTVTSSSFSYNIAQDFGGSIYNDGKLTVTRCTFSHDSNYNGGGGIYNDSAGMGTVTNSSFTDESSEVAGGGIWNIGTLTVTGCTFSSDSAEIEGGGLANGGTLTLTNSTFSGDTTGADGGGIYNDGTLTATNCTLANNEAEDFGGGIYVDIGGDATIYNTIVADNYLSDGVTPSDISGALDSDLVAGQPPSSNNMIGTGGSGGLVNGDNGNIILVSDSSADLGPLKNNGGPTLTIALLTGSPAINKGSVALAKAAGLTTDQRGPGFARIIHNMVDIGAYQIQ
jgi:hypothetical protein